MTTPEAFRRRQRIEGLALLVLGVFTVVITVYFGAQDRKNDQCLTEQISKITESQSKRGAIVAEESQATREVISAALSAETTEDVIAAREDYFAALAMIDKAREENPPPDFPEGSCD